jgi:hypothetical protein
MEMKVAFIFSDKTLTKMMQDADLFEPFKVLVNNEYIVANLNDNWGEDHQIESLIKLCENTNYSLVACYTSEKVYYIDPLVKVVSTGQNWALVEEYVDFFQNKGV